MALTYNVYKGAEKIATEISGKTFKATGLTPETAYQFKVTAVQEGVESSPATLNVTTKAEAPEEVLVTEITPSQKTMTIKVGDADRALSFTVAPPNATDPTFTVRSENEDVATYIDGKVHPVSEGVATITVAANDKSGIGNYVTVTVNPAATK